MSRDHIAELGLLSLGSRFKRLSDTLYQEMAHFYGSQNIEFDPGNFPLVHYLATHGTTSVGAAARHLGISQAAISQKAAALTKTGLIKFISDKKDKRKSDMALTAKGQTLVAVLKPSWDIVRHAIEAQLGEHGESLLRSLQTFEDSISNGGFRNHLQKSLSQRDIRIIALNKKNTKMFDKLNRPWIEEYFSVEPFDEQMLTKPQQNIIDKGGEVWFAERQSKIVGAYALIKLKSGMFEFSKLGVDPDARRLGIARMLLRHAATRAKDRGAHTLRIFTNSKLGPACALYDKEGFIEVKMSKEECARYGRCDLMLDLKLN